MMVMMVMLHTTFTLTVTVTATITVSPFHFQTKPHISGQQTFIGKRLDRQVLPNSQLYDRIPKDALGQVDTKNN